MNYKELLFNKDKALTFYPDLAVILNEYDKYLVKIGYEINEKKWKSKQCGLNAAIVVNQINYWNELNEKLKSKKHFKDGYYWTYHAYDKWAKEDFPFWSGDTVRRAVKFLEDIGLVISTNEYNSWAADNTKWYRIDFEKLQEIINIVEKLRKEIQENEIEKQVADTVNADCGCVLASCTDGLGSVPKAIPEITTENTNRDYNTENTLNSFSTEKDIQSNSPEGEQSNSFSGEKKTAILNQTKRHSEKEMEDMVNQIPLRARRIAYEMTGDKDKAKKVYECVEYFLNEYKAHIRQRHKVLKDETLRKIVFKFTDGIEIERDGYTDVYDGLASISECVGDYKDVIDEYFNTDFNYIDEKTREKKGVDYSLAHFTNDTVLTNMMNHVGKEDWCESN